MTAQPDLFDAPAQAHSATSVESAQAIEPCSQTLRAYVLTHIRSMGDHGATDEAIQRALDMNPSTQRPRRIELVAAGLVRDSGQTRRTASGRSAVAWVGVGV